MSFTHTGRSLSPPSQNRLQQDANYVRSVIFYTSHNPRAENLEKFTMYKIMNIQNEIGFFSEIEKYVEGEILKRF